MSASTDERALATFQAYLRLRTDHPSPDYSGVEPLLASYAAAAGFALRREEFVAGHPLFVLTWRGADAAAPSIVLLSHMDVVPVDAAKWSKDPWAGAREGGRVYGRGAQDMKCVGVQYLEACSRLKAAGAAPLRTVHLLFVPDEEVGGSRGIKPLLSSALWAELNVGFLLDEGLASPSPAFSIFYG